MRAAAAERDVRVGVPAEVEAIRLGEDAMAPDLDGAAAAPLDKYYPQYLCNDGC
jgi:hypothetical protein